jgi:C-terminal processing protease CtpA/Prc
VRSPGQATREVKVIRGQLSAAAPLQAATIANTSLAYFLFPPAVYESLVNDFASGLESLSAQGMNGIILDLRIASNGANWPINALLTLFADGELGEFYSRDEVTPVTVEGQDIRSSQEMPIAVLVGPDTNGTPEIFAAMLQAVGRATIIGMPTPGDIEGFSEFQLMDGSRAFILTSSYRTPDGEEVGLTGVSPDVPVEADWDQITSTEDPVLESAIRQLLEQE